MLKNHEKKIKNRIADLIDANDAIKTKDLSSKETENEKFLIRIKHIKNNAQSLKASFFEGMSDSEVVEAMESLNLGRRVTRKF